MDNPAPLQVYKDLADWYERQGQSAMRDRFLILAAESAFSAGKSEEAERLRQRLLQGNPHHMLKPFNSFSQALQSTNVQIYIHDLQVNYPPETALDLLRNLRGGASAAPAMPQTAPLIEIREEPMSALDNPVEPLKVYPLREESEPRQPSAPPSPSPPPSRLNRPTPPKSPTAVPLPPPAKTPSSSAPARPPRPVPAPLPLPPPPSEAIAPAGAWLSLLLFGMTVTAGIALAIYTLARPFLTP